MNTCKSVSVRVPLLLFGARHCPARTPSHAALPCKAGAHPYGNAGHTGIRWGLQQRELAARGFAGCGGAGREVTRRKAGIARCWWCLGVVLGGW